MALRFRKSIKLAPGIRWNLSGTGSSWTIGPRGASVGIGKRGVYLNSGIPGTGISSRSRLSGPSQSNASRASTPATSVLMTCAILDDGTLSFTDRTGTPVPEHVVEAAKKQNREAILELIQRKCDEINRPKRLANFITTRRTPVHLPSTSRLLSPSQDHRHPPNGVSDCLTA